MWRVWLDRQICSKILTMPQIEIYRLKDDGTQEVLVTGKLLENNFLDLQGDLTFIGQLTENGVLDKSVRPPVRVFPDEGARFMTLLKKNLQSGYITVYERADD